MAGTQWKCRKPNSTGKEWFTLIGKNTRGSIVYKQLTAPFVERLNSRLNWSLTPNRMKDVQVFVRTMRDPSPADKQIMGRTLGLEDDVKQQMPMMLGDGVYEMRFDRLCRSWEELQKWWTFLDHKLSVRVCVERWTTCARPASKENFLGQRFCLPNYSEADVVDFQGVIGEMEAEEKDAFHAEFTCGPRAARQLAELEAVVEQPVMLASSFEAAVKALNEDEKLPDDVRIDLINRVVALYQHVLDPQAAIYRQHKFDAWQMAQWTAWMKTTELGTHATLHYLRTDCPPAFTAVTTRTIKSVEYTVVSIPQHVDKDLVYQLCEDEDSQILPFMGQVLLNVFRGSVRTQGSRYEQFYFNGELWSLASTYRLRSLVYRAMDTLWADLLHSAPRNMKKRVAALRQVCYGEAFNAKAVALFFGDDVVNRPLTRQPVEGAPLFPAKNGVIDLRTGDLPWGFEARHFWRAKAPTRYVPNTDTTVIEDYVATLFAEEKLEVEDRRMTRYFQAVLGYSISGETSIQQSWWWINPHGGNGKSVFVNLLDACLGDGLCGRASKHIFVEKHGHVDQSFEVHLQSARFCVCEELQDTDKVDLSVIKRITGGNGKAQMRGAYTKAQSYQFTYKLHVATNEMPKFSADEALARRIVVVPWPRRFFQKNSLPWHDDYDRSNPLHLETNEAFLKSLQTPENLEKLLAWIVEGAKVFYTRGLPEKPAPVMQATREFMIAIDSVKAFLDEACEMYRMGDRPVNAGQQRIYPPGKGPLDDRVRAPASKVYTAFRDNFCRSNYISRQKFTLQMKKNGIPCKFMHAEGKRQRCYIGIMLDPAYMADSDPNQA